MKNPWAFTILTLALLSVAALVFYCYGLPMLADNDVSCRYGGGGGGKSLGCSSSLGTFLSILSGMVAICLVGIWDRFGPY